jgi:hypothetical protein
MWREDIWAFFSRDEAKRSSCFWRVRMTRSRIWAEASESAYRRHSHGWAHPRLSAHVVEAANRDARSQTVRFSCGNRDAMGSSEWHVLSPWLASCTICV